MIFDLPAAIGTNRKYLVINGVDIDPFVFPGLSTPQYYNTTYTGFPVSRTDVPNAITLKAVATTSSSSMYKSILSLAQFKIKEYFDTVGEDIRNYKKLCFVISFDNYWGGVDSHSNTFSMASTTKSTGTNMNQYDVELLQLEPTDDGKKAIYKFNLNSFYDLEFMYIRFFRGTTVVPPETTFLNIHAIYFE